MRKSQLKNLIKTILLEMDNDEDEKEKNPEDFLDDRNLEDFDDPPEVDQELNTKPVDKDDLRPGSDIEGIKLGGTGMPHGHGFPNVHKKKHKFDRKHIDKTIHINTIYGISDQDMQKQSNRDMKITHEFIQKKFPWIFTFKHLKNDYDSQKEYYPFADYFRNGEWGGNWTSDFYYKVNEQRGDFLYWKKFDKNELKNNAKHNRHWVSRWYNAYLISKKYPTFEQDLTEILGFLNKLSEHSLENPKNDSNYPLYVSLYDTTRRLGGHEEGGWWYDNDDLIDSIKVNNYKEARKAAINLYHQIENADLNGKPWIVLEKDSGGRSNQPPPNWS